MKRVVIVNDTSKVNHFGCKLVMEGFKHLCAMFRMHVVTTAPFDINKLQVKASQLDEADLIIVNGEGNLHDGACGHLLRVPTLTTTPCVLVNTVYQNNNWSRDELMAFSYLSARESMSAAAMSEVVGYEVPVVPDVMLMAPTLLAQEVAWLVLYEPVSTDSSCGTDGAKPIGNPAEQLHCISHCEAIIAGRFHALLSCAALEVPFSAYRANTHKNEAVMCDMGLSDFYAEDERDARKLCPSEPRPEALSYVKRARIALMQQFKEFSE